MRSITAPFLVLLSVRLEGWLAVHFHNVRNTAPPPMKPPQVRMTPKFWPPMGQLIVSDGTTRFTESILSVPPAFFGN